MPSDESVRRSFRPTTLRCNGVALRVFELAVEPAAASGMTVLLLHGYLDAGSSWLAVARLLAAEGHRVLAPDLRGYGESAGVGAGGYYHFADYLADVVELLDQLAPERLILVGHSMGGTIACLLAGTFPDRADGVVLLEGLGPPAMPPELAVTRARRWLADLSRMRDRSRGPYGHDPSQDASAAHTAAAAKDRQALHSLDDAARRLAAHHPRVPPQVVTRQARGLTRTDESGQLIWAHDPLHRTTSPARFDVAAFKAFLREIVCPVLFVSGGPFGWHPADEAERLAEISGATKQVELPDAGHMMHWTRPEQVAELIVRFMSDRNGQHGSPERAPQTAGGPAGDAVPHSGGSTGDPFNWPA